MQAQEARITLAACITAVTAATLAASAAAAPPRQHRLARPAVLRPGRVRGPVTVRPGAIRLPGAPTRAPATTADCEQLDGIACFDPDQLRAAYELPPLYAKGITGKGVTIMIVDSFGSPTIKADLAAFDRQFGYPAPPDFTIIAPVGKIPAFNPGDTDMAGWAGRPRSTWSTRTPSLLARTSCWSRPRSRRPRGSPASRRSCGPRSTPSPTTRSG